MASIAPRTKPNSDHETVYKVMVVDDSAVMRSLLTRTLKEDASIHVEESVANGEMAVRSLQQNPDKIDVVVLDIEMPVMDGMEALPKLLQIKPALQIIMASTLTRKNAEISLKALSLGAKDYLPKPTSSGSLTDTDNFKRELVEKVKVLGAAAYNRKSRIMFLKQPIKMGFSTDQRTALGPSTRTNDLPKDAAKPVDREAAIKLRPFEAIRPDIIAIGSSTGGPQALFKVFGNLGKTTQPIVITQHMPATFTATLAEHINRLTPMPCKEAENGDILEGGRIYVAPGGYHMVFEKKAGKTVAVLNQDPPENFCRPSVDSMLRSLAKLYGSGILVLILTGMGSDGQKGAEIVAASGGTVIAQDEKTSVVWGMPGAVASAGLCSAILPLEEIAPQLQRLAKRTKT